jgi:hypothetical protein
MAFDLSSIASTRSQPKPPRIVLYGPPGVGKTTFAACMPSPIILPTEDGLTSLDALPFDVPSFPVAKTFDDVMSALGSLYEGGHEFKTLVVDSVDWLEPLIWAETCRRQKWVNIEQPGYGRGYQEAMTLWHDYFDALALLRNDRGMAIIQIGHSLIKRHDAPDAEPYDRYQLKLQQRASDKLTEAVDMVLFGNFKSFTTETEVGFNKKVRRGIGTGQRVLYTEERPAFMAKNRHALPAELPFTWEALSEAMQSRAAKPPAVEQPQETPSGAAATTTETAPEGEEAQAEAA